MTTQPEGLTEYTLLVALSRAEFEMLFPRNPDIENASWPQSEMKRRVRNVLLWGLRLEEESRDREGPTDGDESEGEDIFERLSRLCARPITKFGDLVPLEIECVLRSHMEE